MLLGPVSKGTARIGVKMYANWLQEYPFAAKVQAAIPEIGPLIKSGLPTQPEKTQDDLGAPKTRDLDIE